MKNLKPILLVTATFFILPSVAYAQEIPSIPSPIAQSTEVPPPEAVAIPHETTEKESPPENANQPEDPKARLGLLPGISISEDAYDDSYDEMDLAGKKKKKPKKPKPPEEKPDTSKDKWNDLLDIVVTGKKPNIIIPNFSMNFSLSFGVSIGNNNNNNNNNLKDDKKDKNLGDKDAGDKDAGDKKDDNKDAGNKDAGDKKDSNKDAGNKDAGDKKDSNKDAGNKDAGNKKGGDKNSGGSSGKGGSEKHL